MRPYCDCCGRNVTRLDGYINGRTAPWGAIDLCRDCDRAYDARQPRSPLALRKGRVRNWGRV